MDERMPVEGSESATLLGAQLGVGGGIGMVRLMDRGLESVGFSVCSLWSSSPHCLRDCGLTAHAPRHTQAHTR